MEIKSWWAKLGQAKHSPKTAPYNVLRTILNMTIVRGKKHLFVAITEYLLMLFCLSQNCIVQKFTVPKR